MKTKIVILISIGILLASCAPATSTPPLVTNTPVPTTIPANVPTITLSPIATLDPNAPAGTHGKDAQGEYVTMPTGEIARKVEYKTASGEMLWSGWAVEKTQVGGIPLLDVLHFNLIPTKLFVNSDVAGGQSIISLTHPDNTESFTTLDSLDSTVKPYLYKRLGVDTNDSTQVNEIAQSLRNAGSPLSLISSTGEPVEMTLGPETGFITIVVPYDSLDPAERVSVSEWTDAQSGIHFRSTMLGVDTSGNAIGLIASEKPLNELSDYLMRMLVLFHPASIIAVEDQQIQGKSTLLDLLIQYADKKGAKTVPDIIITRRP